MPSRRSPRFYFDDILTAIADIHEFTSGVNSSEELERDRKTLHAVFRNLEIIGEACRQMPRKVKTNHPQIEWRRIADMRNIITHEYFGVDVEIAWRVIQKDLRVLEKQIQEICNDIPDNV
ncbi:MAG: DUF86 domain-containing protein [Chloroflexi bacterium]|nr:DUF86 domain-containing protein [Chloroflexota bacterium]MBI3340790.1 DUF86 domain-containing protein [Chloroflexota bacterium]